MNNEDNDIEFEPESEEPTDEEYEQSLEAADEFTTSILRVVENFDYDNNDEDYIEGTATMMLWCKLVTELGEMGYTEEELKNLVDEYVHLKHDEIVH